MLPLIAHPALTPLGELMTAIVRSIIFSDVGELDICGWLPGNHRISRITDLDNGLIPDLILTRITDHAQGALLRCTALAATQL